MTYCEIHWQHRVLDPEQRRQPLADIFEFLDDLDAVKAWAVGEEMMCHAWTCQQNLLQVVFGKAS